MQINALLEILNQISPFELQEKWDNCGLLIGDPEALISDIHVALEADSHVIDLIPESSALIVHHPLIFKPLSALRFDNYPATLIRTIIQKNITLIALHTNFDRSHLNQYIIESILGYASQNPGELIQQFDVNLSFAEFLAVLQEKLGRSTLPVIHPRKQIRNAAIVCGSGASLLPELQADCLLTGDIKYHDAVAASTLGKTMVDIGHYHSERFFPESLQKELKNHNVSAIIAHSKNPFTTSLELE